MMEGAQTRTPRWPTGPLVRFEAAVDEETSEEHVLAIPQGRTGSTQRLGQRPADRVERMGPVQRDGGDVAVTRAQDQVVVHR